MSLASPTPGLEVTPRALSSLGISISPPPYWTLTEDGPDIATFDLSTPDGHLLTAMAFVPASVADADGTLHPVPPGLDEDGPLEGDDVRAWAANRTDITVGDTGGMTAHLGLLRYVGYEAPAGAPPVMCPEPPSAGTCSVPAPEADTYAELNFFRVDSGRTWAIIFYKDPQSPGSDIDTGELLEAFRLG